MAHGEVVRVPAEEELSAEQQAQDAAAAYDAWFRAEVEAGLREADDPNTVWVTNEEVMQQSAELKKDWLRRAKAKRTTD
jgi:hypothetical protein